MSLRSLKSTREILAQLKSGPGASKLPSNVSKIALTYAIRGKNNSAAAKHFLRENLPRIQYNNPNVEFVLNKSSDASTKPTVTIYFGDQGSKTIDIAGVRTEEICERIFEAKP